LREAGYLPRPFTAEETRGERAQLLSEFALGRVPALVAMRALDEGVDVPEIRQAHLMASSGNPTQFIQRRGRVLRRSEGKSSASLIDYVTVTGGGSDFERRLSRQELARVLDFASTSIDPAAAIDSLQDAIDRQ
jgi:superfamily II DNA or RNA helicase